MAATLGYRLYHAFMRNACVLLKHLMPALFTERQVFAEFSRITSKSLERDFFEALDQYSPHFIKLFKTKKGKKLTELLHNNWETPDVTAQCSVVLKGMSIVLGDNSSGFYTTCFDAARDGALESITIGVLSVLSEDEDGPQSSQRSVHIQPISNAIVLEGGIVMENIRDLPQAVCLLFGLTYALHLDYPKGMSNTLQFIQKVMLGLGNKTLPPKLLTLKNSLLG